MNRATKHVRLAWLIFALIVVLIIFVPKLMAQEPYVMQCNNGICVVSQSVLEKLLHVIDHWKAQAQTCRST